MKSITLLKAIFLTSIVIFILGLAFSLLPIPSPKNNPNLNVDLADVLVVAAGILFTAWLLIVVIKFIFRKAVLVPKLIVLGAVVACLLLFSLFIYKDFIVTNVIGSTGNQDVCRVCKYSVGDTIAYYTDQGTVTYGNIISIQKDRVTLYNREISKEYVIGKVRGQVSLAELYGIDPEELENYYSLYQDEYIKFLRTALNSYLAHENSQICILETAVKRNDQYEGILTGLDAFDPSYYKSRFVVGSIGDNSDFGKDIQIVFQDKPDRIFYAWVGEHPTDKEMCLIGFNSKEPFTKEDVEDLLKSVGPFISDKENSI